MNEERSLCYLGTACAAESFPWIHGCNLSMPDLEAWARPGDSLCTSRKQRPRPEKPTNNTTIHECSVSVASDDARPPGADRQACDGGLSNGLRPAAHQCGRRALTMTCCRGEATLEHYPASLDSSTQAAHATSRADHSQVFVKRASARRPSCCFLLKLIHLNLLL